MTDSNQTPPPPEDALKNNILALRPGEAAESLGISPRLLWQLTKDGEIPCVRTGSGKRSAVLYPIDSLRSWLINRAHVSLHSIPHSKQETDSDGQET